MFKLLTITLIVCLCYVDAFYSANDNIIEITPKNWSKVKNSKHVVLAEFFAPWCGHCKNLIPAYKKAALKLNGLVKVISVDCDAHKEFCGQFQVQGFPTIKVFQSDKSKPPIDYQGQRDAASMVEFAVSKIPSNYIKIIDGQKVTDESFLSENPDLSKVMLFSKNEKTPPLFKALGIEYDQRLLLGEVKPSNKALAKKFNVTKFPSVIVSKHHEEEVNSIERYDGILKYKNLVEFFNTFAKEKKKEKKTDQKVKEEKKKGKETVLEFDPVIPQAKSLEDLKKFCYEQKKTCLISVLAPNEEDTLEETLSVLVETKKKFEKNFFSVYINILETPLFIPLLKNVFDVSDMYPSAVAVNFQRGWYRNFRGGFDAIGLASFLQDISKGKGKNSKIPDLTSFFNPVRSIVKDEL